jgi:hypothetical protein
MAPGQKAVRRLLEKAHLPKQWDTRVCYRRFLVSSLLLRLLSLSVERRCNVVKSW